MSQAMKDSNCEWIGDIPQSWNLTNIGNIYDGKILAKMRDKWQQIIAIIKCLILASL